MVLQSFLIEMMKRLSNMETKVQHIEGGVKPWVEKGLTEEMRTMQASLDQFE